MAINAARRCFGWRDGIVCCYNCIIEDTGHFEISRVSWMDLVAGEICETPPLYKISKYFTVGNPYHNFKVTNILTIETLT